MYFGFVQKLDVGREVARVCGEIFMRCKLGRIDKYRHNDASCPSPGVANESHVATMQRAHRRYEGNALTSFPVKFQGPTKGRDRPHNFRVVCHNLRPRRRIVAKIRLRPSKAPCGHANLSTTRV